MRRWLDRIRFLFEEETAPPGEAPRGVRDDPSGVPRPVRALTRFMLVGSLATSLLSQVIGVRLVAPVDAAPSYQAQCNKACETAYTSCVKHASEDQKQCERAAKADFEHCKNVCNSQRSALGSVGFNSCIRSCERTYTPALATCAQQGRNSFNTCKTQQASCKHSCQSGP